MSVYSVPEGFTLDENSGRYYKTDIVNDPGSGASVQWVTWFDTNTGKYEQYSYPMAPIEQYPTGQQQAIQRNKKIAIGVIAAVVVLTLVLALVFIFKDNENGDAIFKQSDISILTEETVPSDEIDIETSESDDIETSSPEILIEDDGEDEDKRAEAINKLANIPYFGDISKLNMTADQAKAYAQAVRNAENPKADGDNYDLIVPMLIDVSNDGVPLLLIIPTKKDNSPGTPPIYSYYLLGFYNGRLQEICRTRNIAIVTLNGENILCAYDFGGEVGWDFGGFSFYIVSNGTAELIAQIDFESFYGIEDDPIPSVFYVNGESVSENVYNDVVRSLEFVYIDGLHFIRQHVPFNYINENDVTYKYLDNPFRRNDVEQMLFDYANALRR